MLTTIFIYFESFRNLRLFSFLWIYICITLTIVLLSSVLEISYIITYAPAFASMIMALGTVCHMYYLERTVHKEQIMLYRYLLEKNNK